MDPGPDSAQRLQSRDFLADVLDGGRDDGDEVRFAHATLRRGLHQVAARALVQQCSLGGTQRQFGGLATHLQHVDEERVAGLERRGGQLLHAGHDGVQFGLQGVGLIVKEAVDVAQ